MSWSDFGAKRDPTLLKSLEIKVPTWTSFGNDSVSICGRLAIVLSPNFEPTLAAGTSSKQQPAAAAAAAASAAAAAATATAAATALDAARAIIRLLG